MNMRDAKKMLRDAWGLEVELVGLVEELIKKVLKDRPSILSRVLLDFSGYNEEMEFNGCISSFSFMLKRAEEDEECCLRSMEKCKQAKEVVLPVKMEKK